MADRDLEQDARDAYEARTRCAAASAWDQAGMPLTALGSKGQVRSHPLLAEMRRAELVADRLRQTLRPRHQGLEPAGGNPPGPAQARHERRERAEGGA